MTMKKYQADAIILFVFLIALFCGVVVSGQTTNPATVMATGDGVVVFPRSPKFNGEVVILGTNGISFWPDSTPTNTLVFDYDLDAGPATLTNVGSYYSAQLPDDVVLELTFQGTYWIFQRIESPLEDPALLHSLTNSSVAIDGSPYVHDDTGEEGQAPDGSGTATFPSILRLTSSFTTGIFNLIALAQSSANGSSNRVTTLEGRTNTWNGVTNKVPYTGMTGNLSVGTNSLLFTYTNAVLSTNVLVVTGGMFGATYDGTYIWDGTKYAGTNSAGHITYTPWSYAGPDYWLRGWGQPEVWGIWESASGAEPPAETPFSPFGSWANPPGASSAMGYVPATNTIYLSGSYLTGISNSLTEAGGRLLVVSNLTVVVSNLVVVAQSSANTASNVARIATNALPTLSNLVVTAQSATVYPFPEFEIPVGDNNGRWTDYELKASTNNFTNLVYYFKSFESNPQAGSGDTNAKCYYIDDFRPNATRFWVTLTNGNSIASQLASATGSVVRIVYHSASTNTTVPSHTWMSETNTKLVWAFSRWDGATFESNAGGVTQQWSIIEPQWKRVRKTP
jgi:hypothetical protein